MTKKRHSRPTQVLMDGTQQLLGITDDMPEDKVLRHRVGFVLTGFGMVFPLLAHALGMEGWYVWAFAMLLVFFGGHFISARVSYLVGKTVVAFTRALRGLLPGSRAPADPPAQPSTSSDQLPEP